MIRYYIIIIMLLACVESTAQDEKKFDKAISFNFIMGAPVGNFASTEKGNNNESGYAEFGVGFDLNYALINTTKGSGWIATGQYLSFSYDMDANIEAHKPTAPGYWYGDGENWKMTTLMAGRVIPLVKKKKFSFEARAQVGTVFTQTKDRTIHGVGDFVYYKVIYQYHNDAAISFCYRLGVGIKARASAKCSFIAGLDFFGATPTIGYKSEFISGGVPSGTNKGSFSQPMNSIQFSTGLQFVL